MQDLNQWKLEKQRQFCHNAGEGFLVGFHEEDVKYLIDRLQAAESKNTEDAKSLHWLRENTHYLAKELQLSDKRAIAAESKLAELEKQTPILTVDISSDEFHLEWHEKFELPVLLYAKPVPAERVKNQPETLTEIKRAFWTAFEIAKCSDDHWIAPRWDEYINKRKTDGAKFFEPAQAVAIPEGWHVEKTASDYIRLSKIGNHGGAQWTVGFDDDSDLEIEKAAALFFQHILAAAPVNGEGTL
jgi:hypothetical protein